MKSDMWHRSCVMCVGLYAICMWNWNWKLTQDHALMKHWNKHTHRCSAPIVDLEEYSAHDWQAATSVQRTPVTWREWGLWSWAIVVQNACDWWRSGHMQYWWEIDMQTIGDCVGTGWQELKLVDDYLAKVRDLLMADAVRCHYIAVQHFIILHTSLQWLAQNINQGLNPQNTPYFTLTSGEDWLHYNGTTLYLDIYMTGLVGGICSCSANWWTGNSSVVTPLIVSLLKVHLAWPPTKFLENPGVRIKPLQLDGRSNEKKKNSTSPSSYDPYNQNIWTEKKYI